MSWWLLQDPNFLLKYMGKEETNPQECDNYRAAVIREKAFTKIISDFPIFYDI